MGKHRWPTAGDAWAPPPHPIPADPRPPGELDDGSDGHRHAPGEDGGPPHPRGVQWRVARSAALVFLGVALAVGAALFLVRSSEPSAAAVSVQLDAGPTDSGERSAGPADSGPGPGGSPGPAEGASAPAGGSTLPGRAGPGAPSGADAGEGPVIVYVTGAVASPGVITVPAGTRLVEVIERAGGALPEADLEGINLAGIPADGQHIHLLAVGEEPRPAVGEPPAPAPAGVSGTQTGPVPGGPGSADGAPPGSIDINTATLAEIETLPGVGPVLGQRIIDWRDEHGPFVQAADVDAVPGIGPALLEGILPLVAVR